MLFYCFWLSVPVQFIAWKDSSPNDLLCVEWDVKPYTLTHSSVHFHPFKLYPFPLLGFPKSNSTLGSIVSSSSGSGRSMADRQFLSWKPRSVIVPLQEFSDTFSPNWPDNILVWYLSDTIWYQASQVCQYGTPSHVQPCITLRFPFVTYCKTLNVGAPFISRISRAKQNREIKGWEYQLRTKIRRNYYSIPNCMVLICQNRRGQNNFAC